MGTNSNGQVYFSGSLQYAMDENTIDAIAAKGRRHIVASPGQSIAIPQSPVTMQLRDESGENIMLLASTTNSMSHAQASIHLCR